MVRVVFVCLAVATVAVAEAVFVHWETIPASLLVTAVVIPSILIFALMERYLTQWRRTRHIAFMLGLLPFGGTLLYGMIAVAGDDPEGAGDWCKLLGFWYATQTLTAYSLLVLLNRKRPPGDTGPTLSAPAGEPVPGPIHSCPAAEPAIKVPDGEQRDAAYLLSCTSPKVMKTSAVPEGPR